jgi:hypothetical protein
MEKFDHLKKVFICSSKSCNKYLEKPVTLPCGFTVCQEHVKSNIDDLENENHTFECDVCNDEHTVTKFLAINQMVSDLIENDVQLSEEQIELKDNITKIEAILVDHLKDSPEEYVYDYFSNLRNQIDLHRDMSIQSIHKRSDEMIKQLNETEQRCKANLKNKLNVPEFETQIIAQYKDALRNPNLNLSEVNEMVEKLKSSVLNFQDQLKMFKSNLTMNQIINFVPNYQILFDSFGKLEIKIEEGLSEASFQFVLNEFSNFKESKESRWSQRTCFVRNAPWVIKAKSIEKDNGDFYLGLYLFCNNNTSLSDEWSFSVQYELRILHLTDLQKNIVGSTYLP